MTMKILEIVTLIMVATYMPCRADEPTAQASLSIVVATIDQRLTAIDELTEGRCSREVTEIRHSVNQLLMLAKAGAKVGSAEHKDFTRALAALEEFQTARASRKQPDVTEHPRPARDGPDVTRREFPAGEFEIQPKTPKEDSDEEGPSVTDKVAASQEAHRKQQEEYEKQKQQEQTGANDEFENRLDEVKSSRTGLEQFMKDVEEAKARGRLTSSQAKALLASSRGKIKELDDDKKLRGQQTAAEQFEGKIENAATADQLKQLKTTIRAARQNGRISEQHAASLIAKVEAAIQKLPTKQK